MMAMLMLLCIFIILLYIVFVMKHKILSEIVQKLALSTNRFNVPLLQ